MSKNLKTVILFLHYRIVNGEESSQTEKKLKEFGFTNIEKSKYEPYLHADLPQGWTIAGDVNFQGCAEVLFYDENHILRFKQWAKCYDNMQLYGCATEWDLYFYEQ